MAGVTIYCPTCSRAKDEPPGGECELRSWHVWADSCGSCGEPQQRVGMRGCKTPRWHVWVEVPATICSSCGRQQTEPADPRECEDPGWHVQAEHTAEPVLQPALAGDDLVRHLQRSRALLEDQLQYATQLIAALTYRSPGRQLYVTPDELHAVEHLTLTTWTETEQDRIGYKVTR